MKEIKKNIDNLQSKVQKIQKKLDTGLNGQATRLYKIFVIFSEYIIFRIVEEIFEKIMTRITKEAAHEIYKLNENAKMITISTIMRALKIERLFQV